MTGSTRSRSLLVALALAAVLLFFAFRGVDWSELAVTLGRARPEYLALAFVSLTASMLLRGLRWSILLSAERAVSPLLAFWGVAAGYLGNAFLPARAGELLRSALVSRRTGLGTSYVLASALTERILDAVALVLILTGALATFPDAPEWLTVAARAGAAIGLVGLVGILVLPFFEPLVNRGLRRLPVSVGLRQLLLGLTERFLLGLRAIRSPARAAQFYGLTAVLWSIDALTMTLCARALDLSLALPAAFLTLAALGLASAAPSTPGFVGIYQFVAVTILPMPGVGFTQVEALAFILAFQGMIYVAILPWGLLGLWRLSVGSTSQA